MNYRIENKLNELKRDESHAKEAIKALKAITRNRKKNGGNFENMQKNFNGCTIKKTTYGHSNYEKELCVYFKSLRGYDSYSINIYETIGTYDSAEKKAARKPENIIKRTENYRCDLYVYDPDEIENKIALQIKYLQEYADNLGAKIAGIQELEKTADTIRAMVNESPYKYELIDLLRGGYCY